MLYREIIAVCSQIHTKHINTLCGQNVELLNVKPGGTYRNHCAVHIVTTGLWRVTSIGYADHMTLKTVWHAILIFLYFTFLRKTCERTPVRQRTHIMTAAVPLCRRLVAGISPQKSAFGAVPPVRVRSSVDRLALWQFYLQILVFPCQYHSATRYARSFASTCHTILSVHKVVQHDPVTNTHYSIHMSVNIYSLINVIFSSYVW